LLPVRFVGLWHVLTAISFEKRHALFPSLKSYGGHTSRHIPINSDIA
jgi:hypothetical protein